MKKLPPIKFKWHHLEMSTGGTKDVNKKNKLSQMLIYLRGVQLDFGFFPTD